MSYLLGDCLAIQISGEEYIAVFVTGENNAEYYLAFFDFQGTRPPEPSYFANCSLIVIEFSGQDQSFVAFDTVKIKKTTLNSALAVSLISHVDMPGMIGQIGLHTMDDIRDLTDYYKESLKNLMTPLEERDPMLAFQQKSLMAMRELFKRATPANPFPTVKLYRREDETVHYWQIYGVPDPNGLVISRGKLGVVGEYEEIKDKSPEETKQTYNLLIKQKKAEGYFEFDNASKMILQFNTGDPWGGVEDLAFRNEMWDYLDKYLFWTGNGAITGGDIGSGTANLFFHAISPTLAVSTINSALHEKQINRPYIIAVEDNEPADGIALYGARVLYPENYEGNLLL
jgi:hypothetical protein